MGEIPENITSQAKGETEVEKTGGRYFGQEEEVAKSTNMTRCILRSEKMLLGKKRKCKISLDCEMMMREEKMVRRRCLGRRSRVREEENQQQKLLRR